jgi:3-methyladenine DNA glycosylase AlkD
MTTRDKSVTAVQVRKDLAARSKPETAVVLQRFFKTKPGEYGEGDRFRGIRVPVLRELSRKFSRLSLDETVELLQSKWHEDRLLALLLLVRQFNVGDQARRAEIYRRYLANTDRINNWDLVDSSAPHIVGAFLWTRSRQPLRQLARSRSIWERRIAIIATFYFIRRNDFDETLRLARILLPDPEDLIHKAAGWMLREVGQRDGAAARRFLDEHAAGMPRVMLRYAIEKFPAAERQRYLRAAVSIR